MKRKSFLVASITLGVLCFGFIGCSNPVKNELLTYINDDLSKLSEMEQTAISAFESVTGQNYTDDETLYEMLIEKVIPNYSKLNSELEAISLKLKTPEVRKLNEKYIEGTNLQSSAFATFRVALETGDSSQVLTANEKLDQGRKQIREFLAELNDLCSKNGVQLKK